MKIRSESEYIESDDILHLDIHACHQRGERGGRKKRCGSAADSLLKSTVLKGALGVLMKNSLLLENNAIIWKCKS